jgi:hypothetical protein
MMRGRKGDQTLESTEWAIHCIAVRWRNGFREAERFTTVDSSEKNRVGLGPTRFSDHLGRSRVRLASNAAAQLQPLLCPQLGQR